MPSLVSRTASLNFPNFSCYKQRAIVSHKSNWRFNYAGFLSHIVLARGCDFEAVYAYGLKNVGPPRRFNCYR